MSQRRDIIPPNTLDLFTQDREQSEVDEIIHEETNPQPKHDNMGIPTVENLADTAMLIPEEMEISGQKQPKRALAETPDGAKTMDGLHDERFELPKNQIKKAKKLKKTNAKKRLLTPEHMKKYSLRLAREIKKKPEEYCLSYENFIDLIDQSFEIGDARQLAENWKQAPLTLAATLRTFREFVDETHFKSRITTLANKLDIIAADPNEAGYLTASSTSSQQ